MTIRRGQILCAVLGIAIVPWELLANAEKFLSFLGSYNIFMAPLCAVSLAHVNHECLVANVAGHNRTLHICCERKPPCPFAIRWLKERTVSILEWCELASRLCLVRWCHHGNPRSRGPILARIGFRGGHEYVSDGYVSSRMFAKFLADNIFLNRMDPYLHYCGSCVLRVHSL